MMAIANDVDEATWDEFAGLHEFLNTSENTSFGRGLDLEVGDSFFFFSTTDAGKDPTFSYFHGCDPDRLEPWAGQMDTLIEAGYLDCLHSWGEFSVTGGFRRDLAVRAASVLRRSQSPIRVWINHGDECNEQMVGRPGWDDPASPYGHADILFDCGLRYFWTGAITSAIGQDADELWTRRLRMSRLVQDYLRPMRKVAVRQPGLTRFFGNRVLSPERQKGRRARVFQRYGFWDRAEAIHLDTVLSPLVLDELESRGGFLVLYTHLFRRPAEMRIDQVDWSPLIELAARHRAGRIKVATTSRVLTYLDVCARLTWDVKPVGESLEIRLDPSCHPDEVQGLTFYVPDARAAEICLGGQRLPIERNDPDETGRPSVSIPWRPMRYPRGIRPVGS
jgi:hypothetical protein